MRLPPLRLNAAAALVVLALPAALSAQTSGTAPRPPGCRGTNTNTSGIALSREGGPPVVFQGYGEIESVTPGSPAERAGMRIGDLVVAQGGRDLIANPPTQPALAGDTVVFLVRRKGAEIPLTVVMGRWDPPEAGPGVTRVCRPVDAATGG
jgi:S1-C subfamily serine protease